MKSTDENIMDLSRAVMNDVRGDADKFIAEAKAKAKDIKQRARQEADTEREKILEQAARESEQVRSQKVATAELKARTIELERREELLDGVFEKAWRELVEIQRSSDYKRIAQQLLIEALTQLGAKEVQVRADAGTQKLLTTKILEAASKEMNVKIKLGKPLKQGIGIIVDTADGRRQYDNTFETRLKRMQDTLRSPVYRILMGEAQ